MRYLIAVTIALFALATPATAGTWDYLCHDNGDGTYTKVEVPTFQDYADHMDWPLPDHGDDIYAFLVYDEGIIGSLNMDTLEHEDIWARGCGPDAWSSTPTATPEFTEATETPPTPIVVTDPPGYNDPPPTPDVPVVDEPVTQLPDTGSGSSGDSYRYLARCIGFALGCFAFSLWIKRQPIKPPKG